MIRRFKPGKRKCVICGNTFERDINKPFKNWCSDECALVIVRNKNEVIKKKLQAEENRKWSSEKKVMKEGLKKYGHWQKDFQDLINVIVRTIDFGNCCISCNGMGKPQAGHYHTVNSDGTIRYNLHGIHIQDYRCNVELGSNTIGYDEGLIKTYGKNYWQYVKFGLKNLYFEPLKLSIPQIKEKIAICNKIIKELPKEYRTPEERLRLRDELNLIIGIYTNEFKTV